MLLCITFRGVGSMCCLPQPELIAGVNARMKYEHPEEQIQVYTHMLMLFSMKSALLRSSGKVAGASPTVTVFNTNHIPQIPSQGTRARGHLAPDCGAHKGLHSRQHSPLTPGTEQGARC